MQISVLKCTLKFDALCCFITMMNEKITYSTHLDHSYQILHCSCSATKSCLILCDPMDCSTPGLPVLHYLLEFAQTSLSSVWLFVTPWIYSPWNSPGQNTVVGSLSLLQGIFPTQELSWCLLHCRQILYQLSYTGCLTSFEGWQTTPVFLLPEYHEQCEKAKRWHQNMSPPGW